MEDILRRAAELDEPVLVHVLTKKGKELVKYADNLFLRVDDVAYKGFSPDEMDTLVEFLERMNNNLKTYEEEDGNA